MFWMAKIAFDADIGCKFVEVVPEICGVEIGVGNWSLRVAKGVEDGVAAKRGPL